MCTDPEDLRRAALDSLADFGDLRALRILEIAGIHVESDVVEWEGSEGPVRGHRVSLDVDGAGLAELRGVPALLDAVTAALALALARQPGHVLVDVNARWALRDACAPPGYRTNDRPSAVRLLASTEVAEHVREAALAFLHASGGAEGVALLRAARLTVKRGPNGESMVIVEPPSGDAAARHQVEQALAALLDQPGGAPGRVLFRRHS